MAWVRCWPRTDWIAVSIHSSLGQLLKYNRVFVERLFIEYLFSNVLKSCNSWVRVIDDSSCRLLPSYGLDSNYNMSKPKAIAVAISPRYCRKAINSDIPPNNSNGWVE